MPPHMRERFYAFFRFPNDDEGTSEDHGFCDAWREVGGEIWIHPISELAYVGGREFIGRLSPSSRSLAAT